MEYVLLDSSVWIDFFRKGHFKDTILTIVAEGRLASCGLIKAELLPFLKSNRNMVTSYLNEAYHLAFEDSAWDDLIKYRKVLTSKGENATTSDLIIMTTALIHQAAIFTTDKDFIRASRILGFKLYQS